MSDTPNSVFAVGDSVSFEHPTKGIIHGKIFKISGSGSDQQLMIYGETEKGVSVKTICYSNTPTLRKTKS